MSNSPNPRIKRGPPPAKHIREHNYRKIAMLCLMRDFQDRCAYSMQHVDRVGGDKCMEVDHFNPRLQGNKRNNYTNLFPASRHCNGSKSDDWPSSSERKKGLRFLNCCEEMDYGLHIFECPDNHELMGVTATGKYHIRMCDLNAPHLINERRDRSILKHCFEGPFNFKIDISFAQIANNISAIRQTIEKMIPEIPAPPNS